MTGTTTTRCEADDVKLSVPFLLMQASSFCMSVQCQAIWCDCPILLKDWLYVCSRFCLDEKLLQHISYNRSAQPRL